MARITELLGKSRVGATEGMGAGDEFMTFRVILEAGDYIDGPNGRISKNPREVLRDPTNTPSVPYGTPHPYEPLAFARKYTIVANEAPGNFIIRVGFVRITVPLFGPVDKWDISVRGATVPTHRSIAKQYLEVKVPGRPSGKNRWILSRQLFPVGSAKYVNIQDKETVTAANATHFVLDDDDKEIWLRETAATDGSGIDAEIPALSVTFKRVAANFDINNVGVITKYKNAISHGRFRTGSAFHVRCEDIVIDSIAMDLPGALVPGKAWAFTVVFLWSYFPLAGPDSEHDRIQRWKDADGFHRTVHEHNAARDIVHKIWAVNEVVNFETLMHYLASQQ